MIAEGFPSEEYLEEHGCFICGDKPWTRSLTEDERAELHGIIKQHAQPAHIIQPCSVTFTATQDRSLCDIQFLLGLIDRLVS